MTNSSEGAEPGLPAPEPAADPAQPQVSADEAGDPARPSAPFPPPMPPISVQQPYPGQPYPAYQGYPGYPMVQRVGTNGFAIAALVCGIVISPLGIVFGFVALSQIKRTGEDGRGLALAGIWVGAASVALMVIWFIFVFSVFSDYLHNAPGYN